MRTERAATVAVLIFALAACQAAPDSSSPSPTSTTPAGPIGDAETPGTEPADCVDVLEPKSDGGLIPGTLAEVVTDDLVMRTAPRISDDSAILGTTLNQPDIVYVEHGPIEADGYAWYLVLVGGDDSGRGWIAEASRDGQQWVRSLGAEGSWCVLRTVSLPEGPNLAGASAGPDGRIYVFGGLGPADAPADGLGSVGRRSWAYDPTSDGWEELAPMEIAGMGPVALARDGRFWVFQYSTDVPGGDWFVLIYDPAADRWELGAPFPWGSIIGPEYWMEDGRILSMGLQSLDRDRPEIAIYDPASGRLERFPLDPELMAVPEAFGGQFPVADLITAPGGALYVLTAQAGFSAFDPVELSTGPIQAARLARYTANAAAMRDGRPVVVGGCFAMCGPVQDPEIDLQGADLSGTVTRLAEAFDPRSASWTTLAPLPPGLKSATAVSAGGELYVVMDTPFGVTVARYLHPGA